MCRQAFSGANSERITASTATTSLGATTSLSGDRRAWRQQASHRVTDCIWDLLFGDRSRCLIRSYCCYEGTGANCIEHCADIDSIVVGGHRGSLNMFDQRIPFPILKWDHGQSRIWKLEYHAPKRQLLVGTLEGHVSIWDVRKLYDRSTLSTHHDVATATATNPSSKLMPFDDLNIPQHRPPRSRRRRIQTEQTAVVTVMVIVTMEDPRWRIRRCPAWRRPTCRRMRTRRCIQSAGTPPRYRTRPSTISRPRRRSIWTLTAL